MFGPLNNFTATDVYEYSNSGLAPGSLSRGLGRPPWPVSGHLATVSAGPGWSREQLLLTLVLHTQASRPDLAVGISYCPDLAVGI